MMLARRSFPEMHQVLKSGVVRIRFPSGHLAVRSTYFRQRRDRSVPGLAATPTTSGGGGRIRCPAQGTISDMITLSQESRPFTDDASISTNPMCSDLQSSAVGIAIIGGSCAR
jgi:hypothetical protein